MTCLENTLLAVLFVLSLMLFVPLFNSPGTLDMKDQFENFVKQFNKTYNNESIYQQRFNAFQQSLIEIEKLNSRRKDNFSAVYGLTSYSDMTPGEFLDRHLQSDLFERISSRELEEFGDINHVSKKRRSKRSVFSTLNIPKKVDWREKGVITKVHNQKLCGACWAFSTVENMEAMYALKTGKLVPLSVQQLIDCAGYNNDGCNGGDACVLLQWMVDYKIKVETEEEYPLHLRNEDCKKKNNTKLGVQVKEYACQKLVGKEKYILTTLAKLGPVAVAINALTWQNYLGGVIQYHCGGSVSLLNHAVQIVGYDLTAEIPHYIVRNSWGEDFGDGGYLYIAIGDNLCGLANEVSALRVL